MRDQKVLITGGAGFIGLNLATALAGDNEVVLVDDFSRGRRDAELAALPDSVTCVTHDLNLPLPGSFDRDFTHVYHLAAVVGVVYANREPHRVLRTNLLSTINVLDWCSGLPGVWVCFASSSEAYAGTVSAGLAAVPTDEDVMLVVSDPAVARSSYGFSKIAGELLVRSYVQAHGFPAVVARFHNVYGPRMGYEHVIPQLLERAMAGADPFALYGGDQVRAFCYVSDAVRALIDLVDVCCDGMTLVNVGNDQEETKIADLARMVFDVTGHHPVVDERGAPPLSPVRRVPSIDRLRELVEFKPEVTLRRGLELTHEWYLDNRP